MAVQEEMGKMFVGGLSWETTQDALCRYFCRFGEVVDSVVMKNGETGRSRGFGFVTFRDPCCVQMVLESGPHNLDGRTVDPKACNPRTQQKPSKGKEKSFPKVFLGGLPSNVTETDLRSFFTKYGDVVEVVIMYDQEKKRTRGFGFVSFVTDDSVDQVCAEKFVTINGKQVEIKKAEPRENSRGGFGGGGGGGYGGRGRGGGRGGFGRGRGGGGGGPQHMGGGGSGGMGPMGMPNGMGYQPQGWGPAPPQGGFPPQGAWTPSNMYPGPYGGAPGWGPTPPGPYGPYGAPAAQYPSPAGYGGYGYGYNWPGAVPSQVPPAANGSGPANQAGGSGDPYASGGQGGGAPTAPGTSGQNAMPQTNTSAQLPIKQEYGAYNSTAYGSMSSYPQEASQFGPTRNYNNEGFNSSVGNYGGQSDSQAGAYNGGGGGGGGTGRGSSQSYHPYRRQ